MKRIVEIKGVKLEIDDRDAKKIETYRVGDTVKVLQKYYSDSYKSHVGVIIGFDQFEKKPTIIIAYLDEGYGSSEVKFAYLNNDEKSEIEICPASEDLLTLSREAIVEQLDAKIREQQAKVEELQNKKSTFLKYFSAYTGK